MESRIRRLRVAAAGAVLVATMAAAPALADTALHIGAKGTLVARGVAVDVPVRYTCPPPGWVNPSSMWIDLSQAQGRRVVVESASWLPVCDNQPHSRTVRVHVSYGTAFKPGTALAELFLYQEDSQYTSSQISVSREIRLVH
ncbi:hypothetical protein GCM10025782_33440 [Pedococcus ginsenosidimutans]|uniref:Uncharacterized protein n=1 Tax=Pedococcus ginsenosidimutans TaxID=490570 RepID=A0ABP8YKN2_9MICO